MKYLLLIFTLLPLGMLAQQKAMFSQYMFNGLVINPAYSSIDEATNITAVSRHQWVGFEGAPNTQTVSLHSPIKESNSSFGLMLMRDQIGEVLTDNTVMLSFSQRVQLGDDTYVALGADAGISQFQSEYSKIREGESLLDPVFQDENDFRGHAGLGLMMFSKKFYTGISSPFLITKMGSVQNSSTAYRPHFLAQGGYLATLNSNLKFKPNVLLKYVNGSPLQVDVNANFLIKETVWLGASWRSFDSIDFIAELQISPSLQFGYAYDFTTTQLAQVNKGTHEVMLSFRLPIRGRNYPRCYF